MSSRFFKRLRAFTNALGGLRLVHSIKLSAIERNAELSNFFFAGSSSEGFIFQQVCSKLGRTFCIFVLLRTFHHLLSSLVFKHFLSFTFFYDDDSQTSKRRLKIKCFYEMFYRNFLTIHVLQNRFFFISLFPHNFIHN